MHTSIQKHRPGSSKAKESSGVREWNSTLQDTIGLDEMKKVRTWVGASYAVHPDMKSHTRCLMLFGTGGLFRKSSKLKTKSSTEAEHVGASNYLPNLPYFSVLCLPRCPVYTRQNLSAFACIFSSRFPRLLLY